MPALSLLRPVTQKLTSVPVRELPHLADFLASCISNCSEVLSSPQSQGLSGGSEDTLLVHKLKTRISSLLQDRSLEGRWTAVVLVKATVDAGGWEVLKSSEPWVRGLLAILAKPDPASTKKMAIIAITRIFLLTQQYPTLIREITTPLLTPFITACLQLLSSKPSATKPQRRVTSLLMPILEALNLLLPHHPATFRPLSSRIYKVLLELLDDKAVASASKESGRHLFAALHFCAAKNATSSEWETALGTLITSVHLTADQIFRSVLEDWESASDQIRKRTVKHNYDEEVGTIEDDPLHLPRWEGMDEGAARIIELLALITAFVRSGSAAVVSVPAGLLLDLTSRLSSAILPQSGPGSTGLRSNPEVARHERDELSYHLPRIQLATMEVWYAMVNNLGSSCLPLLPSIMEQSAWIFGANTHHYALKEAHYNLLGKLLPLINSSLTKADLRTLTPIISGCAADIFSIADTDADDEKNSHGKANGQASTNVDTFLKPQGNSKPRQSSLQKRQPEGAWSLLPSVYQFIPSSLLSRSLRAELDRTAIVSNHREAMLSSILNPSSANGKAALHPSLLPWLARSNKNDIAFEGLLRPRLPATYVRQPSVTNGTSVEKERDDDSVDVQAAQSDFPAPWEIRHENFVSTRSEDATFLDPLNNPNSNGPRPTIPEHLSHPTDFGRSSISNAPRTLSNTTNSPQKRDFAHLQSSHDIKHLPIPAPSSIIADAASPEQSPKRPRILDSTSTPAGPATTITSSSNLISDNVAPSVFTGVSSTTVAESSTAPGPENSSFEGRNVNSNNNNPESNQERTIEEESGSDFEIPEINMEPDTDEELEDDEEEEMGG